MQLVEIVEFVGKNVGFVHHHVRVSVWPPDLVIQTDGVTDLVYHNAHLKKIKGERMMAKRR